MKRILLAMATIMALATPSHAVPKYKWAVVWDAYIEDRSGGGGFNRMVDRTSNFVRAAQEAGIKVDLIVPQDTSSYGAVGVDDRDWFAANYDILIVPSVTALNATASNKANRVHLGFRPNSARATFNDVTENAPHSPYSGTWDIPVIASSFDVINVSAISFVNGQSAARGNANLGAKFQVATAECPMAVAGAGDTMMVFSRMAERDTTILSQVIPLLTSANGRRFKFPAARADTMTYWRYLPNAAKPGVYWINMREYNPNGSNNPTTQSYLDAIIGGQACQLTGTKPPRPFVAWFDVDHVHPMSGTAGGLGRSAAYNVRDMRAYSDSLRKWDMIMSGPIMVGASIGNATTTGANSGVGFVQDGVKDVVLELQKQFSFHVHDHFDVNTGTWRSSAQDTATIARPAYNLALANARGTMFRGLKISSAGSFGFAQTLPQDDGDWRALKVFGDAGVKAVRGFGGFYQPVGASDVRAGRLFVDALTYPTPWKAPGSDSKVVWVTGGVTTVGSSVRMWDDHAGNSYLAMMATDYPTTVDGWHNASFPIWLVRGAAYYHGSENMQGTSNLTTGGDQTAWTPMIIMTKHTRNMLKLTAPFVVPLNDRTANNRLGGRSAM